MAGATPDDLASHLEREEGPTSDQEETASTKERSESGHD